MEDPERYPVQTVAEIGKRVRAERKRRGLTQQDFAALVGVGVRFVSDLERGKPTLHLEKTLLVLRNLGFDLVLER